MKKRVAFPHFGRDNEYLEYSFKSLKEAEERRGVGVLKLFMLSEFDFRFLDAFLTPGLKSCWQERGWYSPATFEDDVQKKLDETESSFGDIMATIIDAINATGLLNKEETEERPTKAAKK